MTNTIFMFDELNKRQVLVLGFILGIFCFILLGVIYTSDLKPQFISSSDVKLLQEAKEDYFVFGEQCELGSNNCKELYFRWSSAGFWINDIYNTCTYVDNKGKILFDGYCYIECKEKPCSYEELKEVGSL